MSRTAKIRQAYRTVTDDENYYVVDLYEDGRLVQIRELPGKSIHYAEDVVENWETGIIQLLTE
jgi:hypothetical protein